jgi:hypothetical protein
MDSKLNSEKIWKIQKKIVKWYVYIVHILSLFDLPFFHIFPIFSHFNLLFFHIYLVISLFNLLFLHICDIFGKLNSEKIWKIQKKIVKRYGNYEREISWIVKRYGKYGKKGKLNSEMIWKIWKIYVLVINIPKETSHRWRHSKHDVTSWIQPSYFNGPFKGQKKASKGTANQCITIKHRTFNFF